MDALVVRGIVAGYDPSLPIVRGASLTVRPGEIVALLGANGAGKSTLLRALAGLLTCTEGRLLLEGRDITATQAHRRAGAGLGFVPQTENVFTGMTVADTLALAAALLPRQERPAAIAAMYCAFPDLARQKPLAAGLLSGGQRQMLAIARALVVRPRVLMLDEPSAGLSPKLAEAVMQSLARIREGGVAILLVEQNVRAALRIADRGIILAAGRCVEEAPAPALLSDPDLGARLLHAGAPA